MNAGHGRQPIARRGVRFARSLRTLLRLAFAAQIFVAVPMVQQGQAQSVKGITHTDDVTDLEARRAVQSAIPYLRRLGLDVDSYLAHVWRDGGRIGVGMIHWRRPIDLMCWDGSPDMAFKVDPSTFAVLSGGPYRMKECAPLPKSGR